MTQEDAVKLIGNREVYRHKKGQLFTVVGFAEHTRNKTESGEKEVLVIMTRFIKEEDKTADVVAMPVLDFVEPLDGEARFTKVR